MIRKEVVQAGNSVMRRKSRQVKDDKGVRFILRAKGLLARVIQHELDHLDGLLFIDKVDDTTKIMSSNEYIKRFAK